MSGWKLAFQKAKEIEEEGAKDFQDILQAKKRKLDDDGSDEEASESTSGYCQSKVLSKFVGKSVKKGALTEKEIRKLTKLKEEAALAASNSSENPLEEGISSNKDTTVAAIDGRQICRTWLKNHYLSIGSPCNKPDCPRQHKITCTRPESLYGDFAFKGLQPKHKEIILKAVRESLS